MAVAAGEVGAPLKDFDSVVRLYRPKIFRFILASLREQDTAENLTQECFVKAYQARGRFRGEASMNTWLMQIAVNLVRDHCSNSRLKFWRRAMRTGDRRERSGRVDLRSAAFLRKRRRRRGREWQRCGVRRKSCRSGNGPCFCCGLWRIWKCWRLRR